MSEISRKILFVDDEANVLAGLQRLLRKRFEMHIANGGPEGLELFRREGPFAVVVSDYNMPGMNGVEFLAEVVKLSPETVTVMLTGRADAAVAGAALQEGRIFRYLNKPCERETLERTIEDCLQQYHLIVSERLLKKELADLTGRLHQANQQLERRVEERTARLRGLYQFVAGLNALERLRDVAELVVSTAAETLQSRRVSLMLPDETGEHLIIAAACGLPAEQWRQIKVPVGGGVAGRVFARGEAIAVNDQAEMAPNPQRYDSDFFISVPLASASLMAAGSAVGVLNVTEPHHKRPYDEEALATLKALSDAAAIAIHNQIRLRERNEARDAIILALARLAEHRDPETGAHLERVQYYCRMLSEELARTPKYEKVIDEDFIESIFRSSPLHDIGKVGIRDHILLKPGKLTPEEFEVMKTHTTIGGNTIRTLVEQRRRQTFLQMGMEIAYQHHEKYDGTGYPCGLKGDGICLSARILALADVYDALISRRPYKEPMSHAQAVEIIRREDGKHFDPDVVAAFFRREDEFRRLAENRRDLDEIDAAVEETAAFAAGRPPPGTPSIPPARQAPAPQPVNA